MRSGPNDDPVKRPSKKRRLKADGDIFRYFERLGASDDSSSNETSRSRNERSKRDDSIETILVEDSPKRKTRVRSDEPRAKVAPPFLKAPAGDVARRRFLYGEPSSVGKPSEVVSFALACAPFPVVSHVQQISSEDAWNLPNVRLELNAPIVRERANGVYFEREPGAEATIPVRRSTYVARASERPSRREALQNLKAAYPNVPVYKFYKLAKSKSLSPENEAIARLDGRNGHVSWNETYEPSRPEDFIGNFKSVESLKNWLALWKDSSGDVTQKRFERNDVNSDSSDEFLSDSNGYDTRVPNNLRLVIGPCGSGKTSSIYTIAGELDINVLEVNAGSRRTGKRVLSELGEATQSHKVRVESAAMDKSHLGAAKYEKKNKTKSNPSKTTTKKCTANASNIKKQFTKRSAESITEKNNNKMSLILIEEADIIFDEDEGFVSAVSQIVQTSKRPIIIVSSDTNCNHLKKFMYDDNVVTFRPLSGGIIGAWLDILISLESRLFLPGLSKYLVNFNKGDVRKTMLQLYFWISSVKSVCKEKNIKKVEIVSDEDSSVDCNGESIHSMDNKTDDSKFLIKRGLIDDERENVEIFLLDNVCFTNMNYVWWDIYKMHVQKQKIVSENKENKINNEVVLTNLKQCTSDTIGSISAALDLLSTFDVVRSYENCIGMDQLYTPWGLRLTNSLSESETMQEYNSYESFSNDWCQYLINNDQDINCYASHKEIFDDFSFKANERVWIDKYHKIHSELSKAVSPIGHLDRSGFALDYISSLRHICRLENTRSNTNMKRNNRFYHYLRSFSTEMKDHILNDACEIFKSV